MNWKIVITIVILIAIIMVGASLSPTLGNLLQGAKDRLSSMFGSSNPISEIFENRPVEFELQVDKYGVISTSSGPLDIAVTAPNFQFTFENGVVRSSDTVIFRGYQGMLVVNGTKLSLDGSVEAIESEKLSVNMKGSLKTESIFNRLVVEGMKLSEFSVEDATASLMVADTMTKVIGKSVNVKSPAGRFTFDGGLTIEGNANSISIPEANIQIG